MNAPLRRLLSSATAPVAEMSASLIKMAALIFAALIFMVAGAGLLSAALFIFVQSLAGTALAALATGGLHVAAAAVFLIAAMRGKSAKAANAARPAKSSEARVEAMPERPLYASSIDEAAAPILGFLRDEGMERERLALAAAAEIAKQLHPFSLVAFAAAFGVILGRALKQSVQPEGRPGAKSS